MGLGGEYHLNVFHGGIACTSPPRYRRDVWERKGLNTGLIVIIVLE